MYLPKQQILERVLERDVTQEDETLLRAKAEVAAEDMFQRYCVKQWPLVAYVGEGVAFTTDGTIVVYN